MSFLKDTVYMSKARAGSDDDDDVRNINDRLIATELQRNEDAEMAHQLNTRSCASHDQLDQICNSGMSNLYTAPSGREEIIDADRASSDEDTDTNHASHMGCSSIHDSSNHASHMGCSSIHDSNIHESYSNLENNQISDGSPDARYAQEVQDKDLAYQQQVQADAELARQMQNYPENTADGYRMVPKRKAMPLFIGKDRHGQVKVYAPVCGRPNCPDCGRRVAATRERYGREAGRGVHRNGHAHNAVGDEHNQGDVAVTHRARGAPQPHPGDTRGAAHPQTQQRDAHGREHDRPRMNPRAADGQAPHQRGGARPRMVVMVPPPNARMPRRMDLLAEGSRVQGAFTRDEWAGIRSDPFRLLDVLGDRRAADRRMQRADVDGADYEGLWELAERLGEVKKRGLEHHEIDMMPTVLYQDGAGATADDRDECKICLSEFQQDDRLRTLPCMHRFHRHCIDQWILSNAVCPICRSEIKEALHGRGAHQ